MEEMLKEHDETIKTHENLILHSGRAFETFRDQSMLESRSTNASLTMEYLSARLEA